MVIPEVWNSSTDFPPAEDREAATRIASPREEPINDWSCVAGVRARLTSTETRKKPVVQRKINAKNSGKVGVRLYVESPTYEPDVRVRSKLGHSSLNRISARIINLSARGLVSYGTPAHFGSSSLLVHLVFFFSRSALRLSPRRRTTIKRSERPRGDSALVANVPEGFSACGI